MNNRKSKNNIKIPIDKNKINNNLLIESKILVHFLNQKNIPLLKDNKTLSLLERVKIFTEKSKNINNFNNFKEKSSLEEPPFDISSKDNHYDTSTKIYNRLTTDDSLTIKTKTTNYNFKPLEILDSNFTWTDDQKKAWEKINHWLFHLKKEPFFILGGHSGTGKSFLTKMLLNINNFNFIHCAPTNKASKVLEKFLNKEVKTVYSALGLKIQTTEDQMSINFPEEVPSMKSNTILLVDEASMINQDLHTYIEKVVQVNGIRVIYVGDPLQLNPINERRSIVWTCTENPDCKASLKKIVRYDDKLLILSMNIRKCIKEQDWNNPLKNDNDGKKGIFVTTEKVFLDHLLSNAKKTDWSMTKVIDWRNKTVNNYNQLIRKELGFKKIFEPGDLLLVASPVVKNKVVLASTDEEGTVLEVFKKEKPIYGYYIQIYDIRIRFENITTSIQIPCYEEDLLEILTKTANEAKSYTGKKRMIKWKEFWEIRNSFQEVRYSYGITAHRSQGSTLFNCYVDARDILSNHEKREAMKCLYVGVTRAQNAVFSF